MAIKKCSTCQFFHFEWKEEPCLPCRGADNWVKEEGGENVRTK